MPELMGIIQAHLDRYGVTRAEFARRAGTSPQTVQNWKDRATLPRPDILHGVAEVVDAPYLIVLDAALVDAGYRDAMVDDVAALRSRIQRLADTDPAGLRRLAVFISDLERDLPEPVAAKPTAELLAELLRRVDPGELDGRRPATSPDL